MKESIKNAVQFILRYRAMEVNTKENNRKVVTASVPEHLTGHLISSWEGRKNDFGDFFLNLDHAIQGKFVVNFGIPVSGFDEYIKQINEKPFAAMFVEAPYTITWLHELVKFFYNNGIDEQAVPGISLPSVSAKNEDCYGNSTNWANYILSLTGEDQEAVLSAIEQHCMASKMGHAGTETN